MVAEHAETKIQLDEAQVIDTQNLADLNASHQARMLADQQESDALAAAILKMAGSPVPYMGAFPPLGVVSPAEEPPAEEPPAAPAAPGPGPGP